MRLTTFYLLISSNVFCLFVQEKIKCEVLEKNPSIYKIRKASRTRSAFEHQVGTVPHQLQKPIAVSHSNKTKIFLNCFSNFEIFLLIADMLVLLNANLAATVCGTCVEKLVREARHGYTRYKTIYSCENFILSV